MATLTEEDRRALDYQAQQRNQAARRAAIVASLAGNEAAAQAVRDAWAPVVLAAQEAQSAYPTNEPAEKGGCL